MNGTNPTWYHSAADFKLNFKTALRFFTCMYFFNYQQQHFTMLAQYQAILFTFLSSIWMFTNSIAYGKLPALPEPLNSSAHHSVFFSIHSQNRGILKEQMIVTWIVVFERQISSSQPSPGHLCMAISSALLLFPCSCDVKDKVLSVKGWSDSPEDCNLL